MQGSLVLRQFCRIYLESLESVPTDTTLLRWANLIQPATLHHHVVAVVRQQKVTRGRKLRIDGTVVETTIHYSVDSRLFGDGVRALNRTIQPRQHR